MEQRKDNGQESPPNLAEHSLRRVRRARRFRLSPRGQNPREEPRPLLVVEGDSWVAYKNNDIGDQLKRRGYDVESVADHGDRLVDIAGNLKQHDSLTDLLLSFDRKDWRPEAFVVSAGGNDLAKKCSLRSLLNNSSCGSGILNEEAVEEFVEVELKSAYVTLLRFISELYSRIFKECPIPIVTHGYGNAVPDGRPVTIGPFALREPWLEPEFKAKGYTCLQQNTCTMEELVDKFHKMLSSLPEEPGLEHVRYVDVRDCLSNTLENDEYKEYWENELHPTQKGFECVTRELDWAIKAEIEA